LSIRAPIELFFKNFPKIVYYQIFNHFGIKPSKALVCPIGGNVSMRITFATFSLFLSSHILAGTWEAPAISESSIRFVARDKNIGYPTITIDKLDDRIRICLEDRHGYSQTLSGAMSQLANLQDIILRMEPRMQNFIGLVKRHLGSH
jgi:hypothetical protein